MNGEIYTSNQIRKCLRLSRVLKIIFAHFYVESCSTITMNSQSQYNLKVFIASRNVGMPDPMLFFLLYDFNFVKSRQSQIQTLYFFLFCERRAFKNKWEQSTSGLLANNLVMQGVLEYWHWKCKTRLTLDQSLPLRYPWHPKYAGQNTS